MPMSAAIERAPRARSRRSSGSACSSCARRAHPARATAASSARRPASSRSRSRTTCASTTRSACSPSPRDELRRIHASCGSRGAPDRRRLHRARPRRLVGGDGALHGDGGREARHGRPQRLRLRALHRRARLPPGRRAARRADDPGLRRRHRAPGAAAAGPAGPGAVLHAVLRAAHRPGPARGGHRRRRARAGDRACSAPSRGPRRCATQLEAELGLDGAQRLRAVGDRRPGRRPPNAPRRATACTCRRTTSSSRSIDPGQRRAGARTAPTASSCSRR